MTHKTICLTARISKVEQEFDNVAVKRDSGVMQNDGTISYYKLEGRSRGWYATIPELGIRVWLGDTRPSGLIGGCSAELHLIPENPDEQAGS